jgi:hypothetical protein
MFCKLFIFQDFGNKHALREFTAVFVRQAEPAEGALGQAPARATAAENELNGLG